MLSGAGVLDYNGDVGFCADVSGQQPWLIQYICDELHVAAWPRNMDSVIDSNHIKMPCLQRPHRTPTSQALKIAIYFYESNLPVHFTPHQGTKQEKETLHNCPPTI